MLVVGCCLLSHVCTENSPLVLDVVAVVSFAIAFDALVVYISIGALVCCWMKRVLASTC